MDWFCAPKLGTSLSLFSVPCSIIVFAEQSATTFSVSSEFHLYVFIECFTEHQALV